MEMDDAKTVGINFDSFDSSLSESSTENEDESSEEELPFEHLSTCDFGPRETDLNSEEDFPDGSWLGNEKKPGLRVRCPLGLMELAYVNTTCSTPKKMAIALANRLFAYEIKEKNDKNFPCSRELDPILLYGIQCHLVSMFGITKEEWEELRHIINSKCYFLLNRHLEDTLEIQRKYRKEISTTDGKVNRVRPAHLQFLTKAVIENESCK